MVAVVLAPTAALALTAELHAPHVGASSLTFTNDPDDGGLSAAVVWHFVLNGLDKDTPAAQITVTFQNAGTLTATGRVVGNGSTQHFYVGTPDHDVLLGAFAEVDSSAYNNLVLSHVSYRTTGPGETPGEEPGGPGETPGEEPGGPGETPGEEPGDPVTFPPGDEPAGEDQEAFLPFTDQEDAMDEEAFLPFTGAEATLPVSLAAVLLAAAAATRRFARTGRRDRGRG